MVTVGMSSSLTHTTASPGYGRMEYCPSWITAHTVLFPSFSASSTVARTRDAVSEPASKTTASFETATSTPSESVPSWWVVTDTFTRTVRLSSNP